MSAKEFDGGVMNDVQRECWPSDAVADIDRLRASLGEARRERDALTAELVELFGWSDDSTIHAIMHVGNAVRNLRADLDVARRDTERLDWLEAEMLEVVAHADDDFAVWSQGFRTTRGPSLREAIDAARRAPEPSEGEGS